MNIVFFGHPDFAGHQSMPRFTSMLVKGMNKRGHTTEVWFPQARATKLPFPQKFKKWLGYIDQYVLFPKQVHKWIRNCPKKTLFVFTDHALGPWVPLTLRYPHVIHCHDFLAQRSALGEIPANATGWSGRQYQAFIRRGYREGKNFISVSQKTRQDLHRFLPAGNIQSEVVYNGLNNSFEPYDIVESRVTLGERTRLNLLAGYLLHVGGNHWYKNRAGVIDLYDAWRTAYSSALPLIMIGELPSPELTERHNQSIFKDNIHFLSQVEDKFVRLAYTGASVFLFPSLAEGFGWPIAEAMACGCPVITTGEAPMTEVAGSAGFFIPPQPVNTVEINTWAMQAAETINKIINLSVAEREAVVKAGIKNAERFNTETALDQIEKIYLSVLES